MTRDKKLETGLSRLFSTPKKPEDSSGIPPEKEKKPEELPTNLNKPSKPESQPKKEKTAASKVGNGKPNAKVSKSKLAAKISPEALEATKLPEEKPVTSPQEKSQEKQTTPPPPETKDQPAPPALSIEEQVQEIKSLTQGTASSQLAKYENNEHLVIFSLAKQQYGVNIKLIESIIKMQPITEVPGAPFTIEGITNLRGKVLPVIDIHKRLKLSERILSNDSRIIVATMEDVSAGLVVDEVNAVQLVQASDIEPPSPIVTNIDMAFVKGIAKIDDQLVIVLDLEKLLNKMDTRNFK